MLEVAAAYNVFGTDRRDLANPWYEFSVCMIGTSDPGPWFEAAPRRSVAALADADTVMILSGPGSTFPACEALVEAVREANERGRRLVSMRSGVFALAAAGVLDDRRATTHWRQAERLAQDFPAVTVAADVLQIEDGNIVTSAGEGAAIALCIDLVRRDHGTLIADQLARLLMVPGARTAGQWQPAAQLLDRPEDPLVDLTSWVQDHLADDLTVEDLARQAHMSSRTLSRHFRATLGTSPLQWLLDCRVRRAKDLLATTSEPVEVIAGLTGMGSSATLRRNFTRIVGLPPERYRRGLRAHASAGSQ